MRPKINIIQNNCKDQNYLPLNVEECRKINSALQIKKIFQKFLIANKHEAGVKLN